jgi:hypothetical protein
MRGRRVTHETKIQTNTETYIITKIARKQESAGHFFLFHLQPILSSFSSFATCDVLTFRCSKLALSHFLMLFLCRKAQYIML